MSKEIHPETLEVLRERGGTWAAYQNEDLSHPDAGHLQFLAYGHGKTHSEPPEQMPDTENRINWRYRLCGHVDLHAGVIVPFDKP